MRRLAVHPPYIDLLLGPVPHVIGDLSPGNVVPEFDRVHDFHEMFVLLLGPNTPGTRHPLDGIVSDETLVRATVCV